MIAAAWARCSMEFHHESVLLDEVVEVFAANKPRLLVDCTLGGAGHSRALLEAIDGLELIGIDRDPTAIAVAKERLASFGNRVRFIQAPFSEVTSALAGIGVMEVDGLLADFGVSSHQIDTAERGFSFRFDGPLDMRMNPESGIPASELLETISHSELAAALKDYGEERHAKRVARAILEADPLPKTTHELATIVRGVVRASKDGLDPATRTFQGIRVLVNRELNEIEQWLAQCPDLLTPGGLVAAISFHSLEDRAVKHRFRAATISCVCPPEFPICNCNTTPTLELLNRRPITPSTDEIKRNPRARSSKLRVARKLSGSNT